MLSHNPASDRPAVDPTAVLPDPPLRVATATAILRGDARNGPAMSRLTLPSRTTPTWEVELLISAAVAFSLFQMLDPLEFWFSRSLSQAPVSLQALVIYGYFYAKMALVVLITTFTLYIAARAAWVALVGVHSIYPEGPKWENLSVGPIGRRQAQAVAGDIDDAIERADNRASLVFGYGMLAAQFALVTLVGTLLFVGVAMLAGLFMAPAKALWVAAALVLLPLVSLGLIDRYLGPRLRQDGLFARAIGAGLRAWQVATLARLTSPLLPLVTTNVGGRRGNMLLIAIIYVALGVTSWDTSARLGVFEPLRGRALPELSRSHGMHPTHYASQRDGVYRHSPAPYIADPVVEGPYLRLFVPYVPDRHDATLERTCPAIADEQDDADAADATAMAALDTRMRCFADLLELQLDGGALDGISFERYRDPLSEHDGGLAMIDVRALAPGRHVLTVSRPLRAAGVLTTGAPKASPPDRIVFWR
jgi:hypothetical protein